MRVKASQVRQAIEALGLDPANTGDVKIGWTCVEVDMHAFGPDGSKIVQSDGLYAVAPVVLPITPEPGVSRGWRERAF